MKFINVCFFLPCFIASFICADEVGFYQIEIKHPTFGEPPKPLIITETTIYREAGERCERYKFYPMVYDRFSVMEGKEHIIGSDDQWDEYYDAFPHLRQKRIHLSQKMAFSRVVSID